MAVSFLCDFKLTLVTATSAPEFYKNGGGARTSGLSGARERCGTLGAKAGGQRAATLARFLMRDGDLAHSD